MGSGRHRTVGGLRLVGADPVIGPVLTVLTGFIVMATVTNVAEVLLITGVLGGGPAAFGGVGAAVGTGLVAGSLGARRVGSDRGRVVAVCGSAVLIGVLLVAEGLAPTLAFAAVLFTVNGLASGLLNTCFGQVLVGRSRDAERGRVFAAVGLTTQTASVAGLVLGGLLTASVTPRAAYVSAGLATVVITLVTVAVSRGRLTGPSPLPDADDRHDTTRGRPRSDSRLPGSSSGGPAQVGMVSPRERRGPRRGGSAAGRAAHRRGCRG